VRLTCPPCLLVYLLARQDRICFERALVPKSCPCFQPHTDEECSQQKAASRESTPCCTCPKASLHVGLGCCGFCLDPSLQLLYGRGTCTHHARHQSVLSVRTWLSIGNKASFLTCPQCPTVYHRDQPAHASAFARPRCSPYSPSPSHATSPIAVATKCVGPAKSATLYRPAVITWGGARKTI